MNLGQPVALAARAEIRIDKLSLVVPAPSRHSDAEGAKRFWAEWDRRSDRGATKMRGGGKLYEFGIEYHEQFAVQWAPRQGHGGQVRFEWNPTTGSAETLQPLFELLSGGKARGAAVTRVDWAADYRCVLLPELWYKDGIRKACQWFGPSGMETVYFGAPDAEYRTRIYDKAVEQQAPEKGPWWRVEVQERPPAGTLWYQWEPANPYEGLHAADKYPEWGLWPVVGHYVAENGVLALKARVPRAVWRMHLAKCLAPPRRVEHPAAAWEREGRAAWASLRDELARTWDRAAECARCGNFGPWDAEAVA